MCAALSIVTDKYHQHYYLDESESAALWLGGSASTNQGIPVDQEYGYDYMHPTSGDGVSTRTWSLSTVSMLKVTMCELTPVSYTHLTLPTIYSV